MLFPHLPMTTPRASCVINVRSAFAFHKVFLSTRGGGGTSVATATARRGRSRPVPSRRSIRTNHPLAPPPNRPVPDKSRAYGVPRSVRYLRPKHTHRRSRHGHAPTGGRSYPDARAFYT